MRKPQLTDEQQNIVVASGQASDPHTPTGVLSLLSHHTDHRVRRAVAANPVTPTFIIRALSLDEEQAVRRTVAENTNVANELLCELATDKESLVRSTARKTLRFRTRYAYECDCGNAHEPAIP